MKKLITLFITGLFMVFYVSAQSAQRVDEILSSQFLSKGQACYIVGMAAGVIDESCNDKESFDYYRDLKMFKNSKYDELIRFDEFAHLVMQNSAIKKSLWYMITKNKYYALRQLKLMTFISSNTSPSLQIKAEDALILTSKIMNY